MSFEMAAMLGSLGAICVCIWMLWNHFTVEIKSMRGLNDDALMAVYKRVDSIESLQREMLASQLKMAEELSLLFSEKIVELDKRIAVLEKRSEVSGDPKARVRSGKSTKGRSRNSGNQGKA